MSKCKLTAFNLLARKQYALYTGPKVVGTGGFPWVLAINPPQQPFTVPTTKFWIVWSLSLLAGKQGVLTGNSGTVILIPFGVQLPRNPPGTSGDDPFFLNYQNFANREYGPTAYGLRIDRGNSSAAFEWFQLSTNGAEVSMFRRPFLVGPGETIMGYQGQWGTPSNPNSFMQMRICYSQIDQTEDIELGFL